MHHIFSCNCVLNHINLIEELPKSHYNRIMSVRVNVVKSTKDILNLLSQVWNDMRR